jgi:hypothetical protein
MKKLTQKIVREYIRILGGTFKRSTYGDVVVKFGDSEYFTDDLQDALGTARAMQGSHAEIQRAEQYLTDMGFGAGNKHEVIVLSTDSTLCSKCGQDDHTANDCDAINEYARDMAQQAREHANRPEPKDAKLRAALYDRGVE